MVFESFAERLKKQSAEQAGQNTYRQKEAGAASHPVAVRADAAAGDDKVNVGMMQQILAPGMKNAEEADVCAEMFGIARDGEQRFGGGAKQNAIDGLLVIKREARERLGQSEDDVKIFDRQQFSLPALQPLDTVRPLTLRTMAVAAGVIAVARVAALAAFFGMPSHAEVRQSWMARMTRNCSKGSLRVLRYCSPYCRKMSVSS